MREHGQPPQGAANGNPAGSLPKPPWLTGGLISWPEPIPYVDFRLRTSARRAVHQAEIDADTGIILLCGRFALAGTYEQVDDAVSCRRCLRAIEMSAQAARD